MIDVHRCHVIGRKWNFLVSADLYDATLTNHHLLEFSVILEFHGNDLITYAGFFRASQVFHTATGNGHQPFHCKPPAEDETAAGPELERKGSAAAYPGGPRNKRI